MTCRSQEDHSSPDSGPGFERICLVDGQRTGVRDRGRHISVNVGKERLCARVSSGIWVVLRIGEYRGGDWQAPHTSRDCCGL